MLVCETFKIISVTIVLFQFLRAIFKLFYTYILGPYLQVGPNLKEQGKWAVVTGATDGLGKAYAEALAAKGLNVVLISRTVDKLKMVSEEIEERYNVETRFIQADFTQTTEIYEQIEKNLYGLEIGVLVNNVGLSYPNPQYFLDMDKLDSKINTNLINCNIFSVTNMCKMVLPGMIERKKGVIINMSSAASQIPSPMLAVYSASKAYIDKFSTDLSTEYSRHGIVIQSVMPGFVATNMSKIRKSTWMAPTPQLYVKHALSTIGIEDNTMGYYPHHIMVAVIHAIEYISDKYARVYINTVMEKVRDRALKKKVK